MSPEWLSACVNAIYTFVTIAILVVMLRQTRITRQLFEAGQRPYVSIIAVEAMKVDGLLTTEGTRIVISLKNTGPVAARDVGVSICVTAEAQEHSQRKREPVTIFPLETVCYIVELPNNMRLFVPGYTPLQVLATCAYRGSTDKFLCHQQAAQYDPANDLFRVVDSRMI